MTAVLRTRKETEEKNILRPSAIGAVILIIAVVIATTINFVTVGRERKSAASAAPAEATAMVTTIPARPSTTPAATPTVDSIRLYAFGSELNGDGFTAYVEDRPFTLSIVLEPGIPNAPVSWTLSDSESARLDVSDDRLSCEFTALKPSGKNELTISCYGTEVVFPVYLWER